MRANGGPAGARQAARPARPSPPPSRSSDLDRPDRRRAGASGRRRRPRRSSKTTSCSCVEPSRTALGGRRPGDARTRLPAPRRAGKARPGRVPAARGGGRARAGAGEAAEAAETLREALALWRGPPLADFAYESFAQTAIARLEELRLAALERRIEADLALGRHADVVGELKELVSAHPLREGFRAQLMLALYRSPPGRGAGRLPGRAPLARRGARHRSEPGAPGARAGDPAPGASTRAGAPASGAASRFPARRWAWTLVAVGGAVVLAAVAFAVVRLTGGDGGTPHVEGSGVASIDPEGRAVTSFTQAGRTPSNIAVGEGAIWVLDADDRTITQIDPESGRIVKTFSTGRTPKDIAFGAGSLWIGNQHEGYTGSISRIDPASTRVTGTPVLPRPAEGRDLGVLSPATASLSPASASLPSGQAPSGRSTPRAGSPASTPRPASRRRRSRSKRRASAESRTGRAASGSGEGPGVTRIDPETNRRGETIRLPATGLAGIATGAGSGGRARLRRASSGGSSPAPNPSRGRSRSRWAGGRRDRLR